MTRRVRIVDEDIVLDSAGITVASLPVRAWSEGETDEIGRPVDPVVAVEDETGQPVRFYDAKIVSRLGVVVATVPLAGVESSWWPEGVVLVYDDENSRYFFGGDEFDDRESWMAAIGATASGDAVTVAPKLIGAPVYESDFSVDADGWIEATGFESNGSVAVSNSEIVLTNSAADYRCSLQLAVTANRSWAVSARQKSRTSGNSQVSAGTVANLSSGNTAMSVFGAGQNTRVVYGISNNAGALWSGLFVGGAVGSAAFDQISVQEAVPYEGFLPNERTFDVEFTTPASFAGTQVVLQWGISDDDARVRLSVSAAGALSLSVIGNTTDAQAALALGTLSPSTRYRVRATLAPNAVYANLDGGALVSDLATVVPSASHFYIGRGAGAGTEFLGEIHNINVWPEALDDPSELIDPAGALRVYGDSTAVGTGATDTWHEVLAAAYDPDLIVSVNAAGGEDTEDMLARVEASAEFYGAWPTVIMDRPNTGETASDWVSRVKQAIGHMTGQVLVVPPVLNSPGAGGDASEAAVLGVQAALLSDSFFSARRLSSTMQAAYLSDLAGDETRSDNVHFSDFGQEIQANYIRAWREGLSAPVYQSSASGTVEENQTLSFVVTTDVETTKELVGGPDVADYEVVDGEVAATSHVVRWTGNGTMDYEDPQDEGADNTYVARIRATSSEDVHRDLVFQVSVTDAEEPVSEIAAPFDVTWVDGTNPVECVMNVTRPPYPGAIAAGDYPKVRYNGGGTIYYGAAIVDPENDDPDFSAAGTTPGTPGAGLPTQPSGPGYAQYGFDRDPGGPDEVTGDWSSASEGAFEIEEEGSVPVNSVAPAISGNKQVGQVLSTTDGTWSESPTGYTYQWKRNGSDISGETSDTYELVEADAGQAITCDVTASNGSGDGDPATSNSLTIDVYVVYLDSIEDAGDQTTYSGGVWDSINLGVYAPNRQIVVGATARNSSFANGGVASGSVGGAPVSVQHAVSNTTSGGGNYADILVASPTGTSGNISLTYAAGKNRAGAGVWAVYGADGAVPHDVGAQNVDATNDTIDLPAGGVAIGCCFFTVGGGINAGAWTGLIERYDAIVEGTLVHTGADLSSVAGESVAVGVDALGATAGLIVGAFASWGPA